MKKTVLRGMFGALAMVGAPAIADTAIFEDFGADAPSRWEFIADGVMGGVSDGRADFADDGATTYVRLTGTVSTENNGGFIQVRRLLTAPFPVGTEGLSLVTRGNTETYYLFIRTTEMTRPWHFYNAAFVPGPDWDEIRISLAEFTRSHDFLAQPIDPQTVTSVGIAAYGRDHTADLSVASVKLY